MEDELKDGGFDNNKPFNGGITCDSTHGIEKVHLNVCNIE